MAFKRLRVERSAGAVWFGAIVGVFAFAAAQASWNGKFWRPAYMGAIGYVYLALMLLGAYCIFRGLYGDWWRVVHVDLEARKLKTCLGEVVSLDTLGDLEVQDYELRSAATKTLIFRSTKADVLQIKAMLESLLRPGRPHRLYRLRRLTYHRMWVLFLFTLTGFALLIGVAVGELHTLGRDFSYEPEFKLMWLLGFAVCIAWFRLSLFGSFKKEQLRVDPAAGVLQLEDRTFVALDQLGALSIAERKDAYTGRRHTFTNHDLRAANVEAILYTNYDRPRTQQRFDALSTAVLQYSLRRILEAPQVEGDAFRSGPDPSAEARRIAGDSVHGRAALAALARDDDPTVRERAAALLS